MSIKESALNTITALTNSDFIRMVTSAGASRKATLQSIAQHIIESYAGSTLAGSQQSVKSALDALNSTLKHTTVEAVSNASGNIEANIPSASTFVTMTAPNSTYLIIPFKAGTKWYGKVATRVGTALNVATNIAVTVEIDYV